MQGPRLSGHDDRRRARRYRIDVPVTLPVGRGITRDISESGLCFDTDQPLALAEHVEFSLVLGRFDPQGSYRVMCAGEVIRVEPNPAGLSVAVKLRSYDVS
jgi:hypothetical protein